MTVRETVRSFVSPTLASQRKSTGDPSARQRRPLSGRAWLAAGLAAIIAAGLALLWIPTPPALSGDSTGDPALARQLRVASDGLQLQGVAAATGTGAASAATAAIGRADARADSERAMTARTPQEIGSVTKSMTGMLLADAVARGEVRPDTTLGEIFPDLPVPTAGITLSDLATHHSGLPRLARGTLLRGVLANVTYGNPYEADTPKSLLAAAADTEASGDSGYEYSNLGVALLGWALAERAGVPYPQLLQDRLLRPLGMIATVATPEPLPAGRAHEVAANGHSVAPWSSVGSAPAGTGVWSTAEDLGRLAAAVAAGTAPGQDAVTPRAETDQGAMRTGWGWFTAVRQGRTVLLNNGATAGGVSSVAIDLTDLRWVAVTAPSAADSQLIAFRLLGLDEQPDSAWEQWTQLGTLATLVLLILAAAVLLPALRRREPAGQALDRLQVVAIVLPTLGALVLARSMGAWQVVPPAVWLIVVAACAGSLLLLMTRWQDLSWPRRHRGRRMLTVGLSTLGWLAVLGVVMLG